MQSSNILQKYLGQSQQLSKRLDSDPAALQELLHLIECGKDESHESPELSEFFKGEYASYSGQHEIALKHYLEAKGVEHLQFYCYRSSSHIYKKQGEIAKALSYAKKALEIFPEDPLTMQLQEALHREEALASFPINAPIISSEPVESPLDFPAPSHLQGSDQTLEGAIEQLHRFQSKQIHYYLEYFKNRTSHPDHCLYVLQGWEESPFCIETNAKTPTLAMTTEESRKSTGGFFLRWNGTGIAINPGKHFIDYFHSLGL